MAYAIEKPMPKPAETADAVELPLLEVDDLSLDQNKTLVQDQSEDALGDKVESSASSTKYESADEDLDVIIPTETNLVQSVPTESKNEINQSEDEADDAEEDTELIMPLELTLTSKSAPTEMKNQAAPVPDENVTEPVVQSTLIETEDEPSDEPVKEPVVHIIEPLITVPASTRFSESSNKEKCQTRVSNND